MEERLTTEPALERLRKDQVEAIVLTGDVDLELSGRAYGACDSKPAGTALFNSTDELAREVARSAPHSRVGKPTLPTRGVLAVLSEDAWTAFGQTITRRRSGGESLATFHDMLVPYDGVGLASSIASATPARQEVLAWLSGRTAPTSRTDLLGVGAFATLLWLAFPDQNPWLVAAVGTLVVVMLEQLDVRKLRRRFGTDSDHV